MDHRQLATPICSTLCASGLGGVYVGTVNHVPFLIGLGVGLAAIGALGFIGLFVTIPPKKRLQPLNLESDTPRASSPPPRIERDTKFGEAFAYVVLGEWGHSPYEAAGVPDSPFTLKAIVQKARDDVIQVWGRADEFAIYDPLHPDFWAAHEVEWFSLLKNHANAESRKANDSATVFDLMVSRAEFEREWPYSSATAS